MHPPNPSTFFTQFLVVLLLQSTGYHKPASSDTHGSIMQIRNEGKFLVSSKRLIQNGVSSAARFVTAAANTEAGINGSLVARLTSWHIKDACEGRSREGHGRTARMHAPNPFTFFTQFLVVLLLQSTGYDKPASSDTHGSIMQIRNEGKFLVSSKPLIQNGVSSAARFVTAAANTEAGINGSLVA
ncbi:hypothetical protein MTO96_045363, partial [Rhipicephalus appendiculatus]